MTGTGPSLLLAAASGYGAIGGSFERAFAAAGCRVATVNNRDYLPLRLSRPGRLRNRLIRRRAVADYNRDLEANARAGKPDLLVVLKGALILPETLKRIREGLPGTRMININYDNYFSRAAANNLGDLRALIEVYDVFFPSKKDNVGKLKELGAREVRYLPIGYDPCVHYPVTPTAAEADVYGRAVAFIGTCTPERVRFLESIAGADLGIWGGHWDRVPRRLRGAVRNAIACGR
ncbi:MAG TPA: DUF3880 domain-containing protein, partial [bacterium]|nr:DUF3880 domain-containing protein [bacterium]